MESEGPQELEVDEEEVWPDMSFFRKVLDLIKGHEDVFVTVDNGNSSDVNIVLPELLKHSMKGTFFISAGLIKKPGYVSQGDVLNLSKAGMIIGTHGMYHERWRSLGDTKLYGELKKSKSILEEITGKPVLYASCLSGNYDGRVLGQVRKVGFERLYTSDPGIAKESEWLQARYTLRRYNNLESVEKLINPRYFSSKRFLQKIKTTIKRLRQTFDVQSE